MESPKTVETVLVTTEVFPLKKEERLERPEKAERTVKVSKPLFEEKKMQKNTEPVLTKKVIEVLKKSKKDKRDDSSDSEDSDEGQLKLSVKKGIFFLNTLYENRIG